MNMPIAQTLDSDFRVLADNEIDNVNGGFIWFVAAAAYLLFVGGVAGYYAGSALASHCSCQ
jgi:lactobin A/cerein 7B family class IIb bacteriocin